MAATDNQPDWDAIAEKFDMWLPHIAPAGEAMLQAIDIKSGDRVLDVASGTGEPALTLAARMGDAITVVGTDAAAGMVRAAQGKVAKSGMRNIQFKCMPAEALAFPDNHFDIVISRFGAMLFQDSAQGLKEMARVLKPGGQFALTVWYTAQTMPIMHWTYEAFKDKIPSAIHPPVAKMVSLGDDAVLGGMLRAAGFSEINISTRELKYSFASFDEFWDMLEASDILKVQLAALEATQHGVLRDEIRHFARDCVSHENFTVPHSYVLASGRK